MPLVEVYEAPYAEICGYPFDGSSGGQAGCNSNNIATLIYDMDAAENSFVVLNYLSNIGGNSDLRLLIPDAFFSQDPSCAFGGAGCTVYVVLYSEFGADSDPGDGNPILQVPHVNSAGFERWGLLK